MLLSIYADLILFYRRLGALLCLSYLLGSSDLHAENVIAHGAYPMIIDHECMLRPLFENSHQAKLTAPRHTVLHTFLLPSQYLARRDYNGLDVSGIAGQEGQETPYSCMQWHEGGTDKMHLQRRKIVTQPYSNIPKLNDKTAIPENYEEEITSSFKAVYRFILAKKGELLAKDSPLNIFSNIKVRVVCNETNTYKKLLAESLHPMLLRSYQAYRKHFCWLKKHANFSLQDACFAAEQSDLLCHNVPYFFSFTNRSEIYDARAQRLPVNVICTALDRVKYQLRLYFGIEDMMFQCRLIENSFTALRLTRSKRKTWCRVPLIQKNNKLFSQRAIDLHELYELSLPHENFLCLPIIQPVGIDAWTAGVIKI